MHLQSAPRGGGGPLRPKRNGGGVIGDSRYLKLGNLFRTNGDKIIRPAASDPSTSLTAGPPPLSGEDWGMLAVRPLRGRGTVAHQRNGGGVIGDSRYLKLGNLFCTNGDKIVRPAASDPSTSLTAGPPPLSGEDRYA